MSQESFTSVDTKFKHPVPKTIYKNGKTLYCAFHQIN